MAFLIADKTHMHITHLASMAGSPSTFILDVNDVLQVGHGASPIFDITEHRSELRLEVGRWGLGAW